jgi:hypothetical protein
MADTVMRMGRREADLRRHRSDISPQTRQNNRLRVVPIDRATPAPCQMSVDARIVARYARSGIVR